MVYTVFCFAFFAWVLPLQTGAQSVDLPQGAYPKVPYKVLILSERTTTPEGELNPWSLVFRQELFRELTAQSAIVLEELDIPAGVRTSPEEMENSAETERRTLGRTGTWPSPTTTASM